MELSEYAGRYGKIRFERSNGVLEVTLHTRDGEALWGSWPVDIRMFRAGGRCSG